MSYRHLLSLLVVCTFQVCGADVLAAMPETTGFRIDNAVYSGSEETPTVRTTTIFLNGVVYDFMEKPEEAIVLEPELGRFTLLNMARRIRTELPVSEVTDLIDGFRERAARHESSFVQFLAEPEFMEKFDLASSALILDSPWITYRVDLTTPDDPSIVEDYRAFADLYCQMNAMLNPSQAPPFARMQLNAALAKRGALPTTVHLTLRPKRTFPPTRITLRSEHELVRSVGQPDLDRITQTREFMRIFKQVSFEEYRRENFRQAGPPTTHTWPHKPPSKRAVVCVAECIGRAAETEIQARSASK